MEKTQILGLICPYCGVENNGTVIDTRPTPYGRRRRRECANCGKRFTTIETCVNLWKPMIKKERGGSI